MRRTSTFLGIAATAVLIAACAAFARRPNSFIHDLLFRRRWTAQVEIVAGQRYESDFGPSFTFALNPMEDGWILEVHEKGSSADLSRLTPPFHFAPNPRYLSGWHFRNSSNTGPNQGDVNAPGERREFCFWPGAKADVPATLLHEAAAAAGAFGRGELEVLDYELKDLAPGQKAAFQRLSFRVSLSWPSDYRP